MLHNNNKNNIFFSLQLSKIGGEEGLVLDTYVNVQYTHVLSSFSYQTVYTQKAPSSNPTNPKTIISCQKS